MFITELVSKNDKSRDIKLFKSENIYDISVKLVLTFDNFKYSNDVKLLNIYFEKLRFRKSKFDKSKEIKELQP